MKKSKNNIDKKEKVKNFFEQTNIYFHFDYNIKIRTETVAELIGNNKFNQVVDIPCGNGFISLKNAQHFKHLTLVDFSENMINLAKNIAQQENINNVQFKCSDLFEVDLEQRQFDLIISLGILAHVDDVNRFLTYIQGKVKKGGKIIIQNTDSSHFYSKLISIYLRIRKLLGKDKYTLNKIPAQSVEDSFEKAGFTCQKVFRYNQSFLGFSRLFTNEKKYELTRKYFGNVAHNKNAQWGSDCIYLFEKK